MASVAARVPDVEHGLRLLPPLAAFGCVVSGVWQSAHEELHRQVREQVGKKASPTAAVMDSQSVKTSQKGGLAASTRVKR